MVAMHYSWVFSLEIKSLLWLVKKKEEKFWKKTLCNESSVIQTIQCFKCLYLNVLNVALKPEEKDDKLSKINGLGGLGMQ